MNKSPYKTAANLVKLMSLKAIWMNASETIEFKKYLKNKLKNKCNLFTIGKGKLEKSDLK